MHLAYDEAMQVYLYNTFDTQQWIQSALRNAFKLKKKKKEKENPA